MGKHDPRVDSRSDEERAFGGPPNHPAQQRVDPAAVAEAERVEKERLAAEKAAAKAAKAEAAG